VVTWSGGSRLSACSHGKSLEKDLWSLSVEGSNRDREAISAWEYEDPKTRRSAEPTKVGVCVRWYLSLHLLFSIEGRNRKFVIEFCMDKLKQCRRGDVKRDLCPIQLWKGK
jgi:hypothetical protein